MCGPSSAGYVNVWPYRDGYRITHRPAGSLHCKGQARISTYAEQKRRLPACPPELKGYPLASDSLKKGLAGKKRAGDPSVLLLLCWFEGTEGQGGGIYTWKRKNSLYFTVSIYNV